MVLPGAGGNWLDRQLETTVLEPVGFLFVYSGSHIHRTTNCKKSTRKAVKGTMQGNKQNTFKSVVWICVLLAGQALTATV